MARKNGRGRPFLTLVVPKADARFYIAQAQASGGSVLVLGSASGTLALEIASAGVSTLAVDPSPRMVAAAEALKASAPPAVAERLRVQQADLRALRLEERFPLVMAPHNALGLMGTLADLESLLATVRHHLAGDGTFVFDLLNPRAGLSLEPSPPPEPSAGVPPHRPIFAPHLRERRRTPDGKGLEVALHRLRLRPFRPEEVDRALQAVGLVARERYGNFEGRPFAAEEERQVVVAGVA
jgi:SAM-dependent methyltransferase